jgi:hypothetical protein
MHIVLPLFAGGFLAYIVILDNPNIVFDVSDRNISKIS